MFTYVPTNHIYTDVRTSSLTKDVARLASDVGVEPLQQGSVGLNARVTPDIRGPAVVRPVRVDVRPASEVVFLNHVDEAAEVLDGGSRVGGGRRLDTRLSNPLGLLGEVDVDQDVGVENITLAVDGIADGDANIVVEDGEAFGGVNYRFLVRRVHKGEYGLTLVVNNIITGVEGLGRAADGVEHELGVGDLAADEVVDVAVGGGVDSVVEGVKVELGVVGVGMEVAGDLVVGADEVLDVGVLLEVLSQVVERSIKDTVADVPAELGALVYGIAVLGHGIFPAKADLDEAATRVISL